MTASPVLPVTPQNWILGDLDKSEYERFFSQLERVTLAQGEVVYEPGARIEYVYFPVTAIFSMLATMIDGSTVEVGPIGHEGLVGLRVYLGAATSRYRVIIHIPGEALRMKADHLREELRSGKSSLAWRLLRYTQMLLAMTGQSSACNKLHSLQQQLARWMLMMRDYMGNEIDVTHELMALTLGVRRAGVSTAAYDFKKAGAIDYKRGHIIILDGDAMEAAACECYLSVKEEYEALYADLVGDAESP